MPFNLSEAMLLLAEVFSRLITANDRLQGHAAASEVSKSLQNTLILSKPIMRFNVLDILSRRQSLLCSQYVSHKSSSASNTLGHGKLSLKRSANKLDFSIQLTFF